MKPIYNQTDGLIPVIIQNNTNSNVLMLGYMNSEAFEKTQRENRVTFFSRSKQRLWTKGETSGNFLDVVSMELDCDSDALLIKVNPTGPTCHTGTTTCFGEPNSKGFLYELEQTIDQRISDDDPNSYTNKLFKRGINKVAQKVGEEAVEVVIEAKDDNRDLFLNESADLLYHFLILLRAKNATLNDVEAMLAERT
ncbi:MAG: bifunctional phosphoribosyl-AMP cyclohydrolase/phosphoribosyl-ATP diphosphatase HisIE [Crocinitomicaceae bacterium]|nr:bifunctional phosphoribosyl-AMP cyclohydrolase/phosphoribosyl-ATP diphosphatase HisIE [Crocinitomicaceae bacterium]